MSIVKLFLVVTITLLSGCFTPDYERINALFEKAVKDNNPLAINAALKSEEQEFVMPSDEDVSNASELVKSCIAYLDEHFTDQYRRKLTIEELAALSTTGVVGRLELMLGTDGLSILPMYGDRVSEPFNYFGNPTTETKKKTKVVIDQMLKDQKNGKSLEPSDILVISGTDNDKERMLTGLKCDGLELQTALMGYKSVRFDVANNYMHFVMKSNLRSVGERMEKLLKGID